MLRFGCFLIFGLLANALSSYANASDIRREIDVNIKPLDACFRIDKVRLEENGLVTLSFTRSSLHKYFCKENILYDVKTYPKDQVRGAKGVNGRTPDNSFLIQVTPKTDRITLSILKKSKAASDTFTVKSAISDIHATITAEKSLPSWQKAFQATESKLAETAAADKTAPKIRILSPTAASGQVPRVDTYTTFLRGQVTDEAGVMNILVQGKKVGIKADGSFAAKIKLAVGRNDILVQAEDINSNVAEAKVTIVRDEFISEQTLVDVDMPPKTRMNNPDALAVVIGVESYQYVPDATFAYNDAEVFREYLAETMGMKRQRIKLATNRKATQAEFSKLLGPNGWLARNITKGKSDVVVYFSGHGIASPDAKSSGLLPHDVDPNYSVGLQTKQLYQDLAAMGAKSVTVFLDACFTGQTRNSEMLIANARPIVIRPIAAEIPPNVTVISAASGSQISGALEEKEHGLFTYYLLKGLGGDADSNKDKSINISELKLFVSSKVKEQAALDGREQTPELQGSADKVLVRFQ
ncbi:caspase family protein [Alphaproteobacteria bacterium]|nr:caspase family protein [Alphaproteobacteria bacterium]